MNPVLEGDLRAFPPADVFQFIRFASVTGRLELEHRGERAEIHFEHGRANGASTSGRAVRTGEVLVHHGATSEAALARALERQHARPDQRIGALLVEDGAASESQVRRAVDEVIRRILYAVTSWREGRFAFFADATVRRDAIHLDLEIDRVILDALSQVDLARNRE